MNALIQNFTTETVKRAFTEEMHIEDFDLENGSLAVDVTFAFDVTHEPADPSTGYTRETWEVTGEIASVTIGGLTIHRNPSNPYGCDLISLMSQNYESGVSDLTHYDEFLAEKIQAEFETGDRSL